jgi:hypothetical protein
MQPSEPVPLLQLAGRAILEISMTEKKKEFLGGDDALARAAGKPPASSRQFRAITTRDHEVIQQWARRHKAEPATGEESRSGPAVVRVNDGGAGVRFNFPGVAPYRPIDWEEWFDNFDRHNLSFVYEEEVADRAFQAFKERGEAHGHDKEDWLEAEQSLERPGTIPSARYRLIREEE